MAIAGIDLGTTNSLAVVYRDGKSVLIPNKQGDIFTPGRVAIDKIDDFLLYISRGFKQIIAP